MYLLKYGSLALMAISKRVWRMLKSAAMRRNIRSRSRYRFAKYASLGAVKRIHANICTVRAAAANYRDFLAAG